MSAEPKVLKFPSVVPDGIYRIRSAARMPRLYLQWTLGDDVQPHTEVDGERRQLWKIFSQEDDVYIIENVYSEQKLGVKWADDVATGQKTGSLVSGTFQNWCIDPRGDAFNISMFDTGMCIDLTGSNSTIIWPCNNFINQRWYLEIMDNNQGEHIGTNPIAQGVYNIVNRATNADATIYTPDMNNAVSAIRSWPTYKTNIYRTWRVIPDNTVDNLRITYTENPVNSLRYLKSGPYISAGENICRIVPVPGTSFFHIKLGREDAALCLQDYNAVGSTNLTMTQGQYNSTDQRQQWQFVFIRP